MTVRGESRGTESSTSAGTRRCRAVSSTIGVVLVLAITVALAASVAGLVFGFSETQETTPHASLSFAVDTDTEKIEIEHDSGETLYADRTRIVWEIGGTTLRSSATETDEGLTSGKTAVFTFDGSTASTGAWTTYDSPGSVDIQKSDVVNVTLYDTESNTVVFSERFTAEDVLEDL